MPDFSPLAGLPLPLGNENDTRANYRALILAEDAAFALRSVANQPFYLDAAHITYVGASTRLDCALGPGIGMQGASLPTGVVVSIANVQPSTSYYLAYTPSGGTPAFAFSVGAPAAIENGAWLWRIDTPAVLASGTYVVTDLRAQLPAEPYARAYAQVVAQVAAEATLRTSAVSTEATARANADATEVNARAAAITTEANTRAAAISTEAGTRLSADNTEAGTRAAAITTEANTRSSADSNLQAQISNEVAARQAGILNTLTVTNQATVGTYLTAGSYLSAPSLYGTLQTGAQPNVTGLGLLNGLQVAAGGNSFGVSSTNITAYTNPAGSSAGVVIQATMGGGSGAAALNVQAMNSATGSPFNSTTIGNPLANIVLAGSGPYFRFASGGGFGANWTGAPLGGYIAKIPISLDGVNGYIGVFG